MINIKKHFRNKLGFNISRRALRVCSLYRRNKIADLPVDLQALKDFHLYESRGMLPEGIKSFTEFSLNNGYANGKWISKLNIDTIRSDIENGLMFKYEYMNASHFDEKFKPTTFKFERNKWFIYPQLKNIVVQHSLS